MASEGCETGTVLVADMQTQGKGRRGRTWYSPKGTSLSFSLLLRPEMNPEKASMITLLMAMAVYDALQPILPEVKIKWPNDIVVSGKKVCGILTQMRMDAGHIGDVIVGCGINVNQDFIPEELYSYDLKNWVLNVGDFLYAYDFPIGGLKLRTANTEDIINDIANDLDNCGYIKHTHEIDELLLRRESEFKDMYVAVYKVCDVPGSKDYFVVYQEER